MSKKVIFEDLGRISYQDALSRQVESHKNLIDLKMKRRDASSDSEVYESVHKLFFCEHKPVYTLGKSGDLSNLLLDKGSLEQKNIEFHKTNRGGDITFHGLGQLVAYPIFDLDYFYQDIGKYVRNIEEVIIRALDKYGISGTRLEKFTGVWVKDKDRDYYRKVCAIGVHTSHWVTMHGLALNVNTDLNYFDWIIPCGITKDSKGVTSMKELLGREVDYEEVKTVLKNQFKEVFELEYV